MVVAAVAAAAAVTVAATTAAAAARVADLQWEHCTGIKRVGRRSPFAADFARGPSF